MPRPSPAGGTANCVLARAGRGSPEQRNEASSPRGTESLRTRRWRKPDSNHRSRVTRPSFRRRLISLAWLPTRGKVGANENRYYEDAGRLPRNRWFESGSLQQRVSRTPHHPIGPGETSKASRVAILPRLAGLRYVVEVTARAAPPACRADPDRSVPADDRSADDGLGQAPRERPTLCSGHDQHDPSRLDEHRRTPRSSAFVPARSSSPAICRPMISEWYSNGVSLNSP